MNLIKQGEFLLLDGATGSNLMAAGLPAGVCVETWVAEHPAVLQNLQQEFVKAGSGVVLASTFGANPQKLSSYNLESQTDSLNKQLYTLSVDGVGDSAVVAGDVSPSGLFLAPMGDATFDDLLQIYDAQIAALQQAGAELVVIETQMTMADARAALICAKKRELTAFVTITVEAGGRTLSGMSLPAAVVTLQSMGADAVGLNCSCGPVSMAELLKEAAPVAKVPLIAKPNAGEPGNPLPPEQFGQAAANLADCGATILGGCCGTTPNHIACLVKELQGKTPQTAKSTEEYLSDERQVYALSQNPVTETFAVTEDLMDDLMDVDPDTDLVVLSLQSAEDAHLLADALSVCRVPLCFASNNTDALTAALKVYQGRAAVQGEGVTSELIQIFGCLPL